MDALEAGSWASPANSFVASSNFKDGDPFGMLLASLFFKRLKACHALLAVLSHEQPAPHLQDAEPRGCVHFLLLEMHESPHGAPLQHCRPVALVVAENSRKKSSVLAYMVECVLADVDVDGSVGAASHTNKNDDTQAEM